MKPTMTALVLSLTVTTAAAALAIPAVQAADDGGSSKFQTFDATPKAPRKEDVIARQIVVEQAKPKVATPKAPIVASIEDQKDDNFPAADKQEAIAQDNTVEPVQDKFETTAETPKQAEQQTAATAVDDDAFAPKTSEKAPKVEMPTVFTETQKDLFEKLSPEQQVTLVDKLVKKYGHDTMYPKNVSRDYLKEYQTTPSYKDDYGHDDDSYSQDGGYNTGYGYGYSGSSYSTSSNYNCQ